MEFAESFNEKKRILIQNNYQIKKQRVMIKKTTFLIALLFTMSIVGYTQSTPFQIALEPVNISGLGGIQAFAWGQYNGKWLIVGGRLDGLHQRQAFVIFASWYAGAIEFYKYGVLSGRRLSLLDRRIWL